MSDINLDDLIKKDKENKKGQKKTVAKKGVNKAGPRRRGDKPQGKKIVRNNNTNRFENKRFEGDRQPIQRQSNDDGRKLRVIGLHPDITSAELFEMFNKQGALDLCKIDQDNFGRSLTTATVVYHNVQNAQSAKRQFDGQKILNSTISVEFARSRPLVAKQGPKIFKRDRSPQQSNSFNGKRGGNQRQPFKKRFKGGNRNNKN